MCVQLQCSTPSSQHIPLSEPTPANHNIPNAVLYIFVPSPLDPIEDQLSDDHPASKIEIAIEADTAAKLDGETTSATTTEFRVMGTGHVYFGYGIARLNAPVKQANSRC